MKAIVIDAPLRVSLACMRCAVRAACLAPHPTKPEFALQVEGADGISHVLAYSAATPVPLCIWKLGGQSSRGARSALAYSWHSSCGGKSKPVLLASNGSQVGSCHLEIARVQARRWVLTATPHARPSA